MTTITIGQRKGGNGKSTSTLNLAHAFAQTGKQVLLIDLDDQKNSTSAIETAERRPTKLGCRLSQISTSLNTCQRVAPITLAAITRCLRALITP